MITHFSPLFVPSALYLGVIFGVVESLSVIFRFGWENMVPLLPPSEFPWPILLFFVVYSMLVETEDCKVFSPNFMFLWGLFDA